LATGSALTFDGAQLGVNGITVGRGAGAVATNTTIGNTALTANTTGVQNTAAGYLALQNFVSSYNTAFGAYALVGAGAGAAIGQFNTAVGVGAGNVITTGTGNTLVGMYSGVAITTGSNNIAIGGNGSLGTLSANTTGSNNTAVGQQALAANTTASNSTAVGYQAGYTNTTGANNVALGYQAMYSNNSGSETTAVGAGALYSMAVSSGYQAQCNTAAGRNAGYSLTTGNGNLFLGRVSGYSTTTGSKNTFVGGGDGATNYSAGYFVTTGSSNTIIGAYNGNQGGLDIRTASNYIVLSDGDGNPRGIFDANGSLLVGTTSTLTASNRKLNVLGSAGGTIAATGTGGEPCLEAWQQATSGNNIFHQFGTEGTYTVRGSISYNRAGGLTVYNTTSDYRAKDIIGPIQDSGATIDALKVYEGQMKGATQSRPMLVAHEAQAITPYAVTGEKDAVKEDGTPNYQQMDVSSLVPLLIAEIQSLRIRISQLEAK
jgi:hypothetical protein